MNVLEVTFPPLPANDVNGQPLNATGWNIYESDVLIGQALPTDATFDSNEITEARDYSVTISLVNAVGEGAKSDPVVVTLTGSGVPPKPDQPGVKVTVK
jgi:hypothetical protein